MHKFTRSPPPPAWAENEERWNQQWVDRLRADPTARFAWYKHEGRTAREIALPELKAQTQEHCSFCDGFPIDVTTVEPIEHFRPKRVGRFPELAYSWRNLYYCCNRCQSDKCDKWDEGLLAPDADDYEFDRYFEFDYTTGAMRPATTAEAGDRLRANVTIETYGLDSPSLRRRRRLELRKWNAHRSDQRQSNDFAYRDYIRDQTHWAEAPQDA